MRDKLHGRARDKESYFTRRSAIRLFRHGPRFRTYHLQGVCASAKKR